MNSVNLNQDTLRHLLVELKNSFDVYNQQFEVEIQALPHQPTLEDKWRIDSVLWKLKKVYDVQLKKNYSQQQLLFSGQLVGTIQLGIPPGIIEKTLKRKLERLCKSLSIELDVVLSQLRLTQPFLKSNSIPGSRNPAVLVVSQSKKGLVSIASRMNKTLASDPLKYYETQSFEVQPLLPESVLVGKPQCSGDQILVKLLPNHKGKWFYLQSFERSSSCLLKGKRSAFTAGGKRHLEETTLTAAEREFLEETSLPLLEYFHQIAEHPVNGDWMLYVFELKELPI